MGCSASKDPEGDQRSARETNPMQETDLEPNQRKLHVRHFGKQRKPFVFKARVGEAITNADPSFINYTGQATVNQLDIIPAGSEVDESHDQEHSEEYARGGKGGFEAGVAGVGSIKLGAEAASNRQQAGS